MKKLLAISLLLASSISVAGSLTPLNKAAATSALSDKTITTISAATLDGKVISDSFTGYLSKDGKIQGKFTNKPSSDPQTDQGTWMVESNGKVCFTWDHWSNGKKKCMEFYKLSNALLIVNDDKGFESLILTSDIKDGNQLS